MSTADLAAGIARDIRTHGHFQASQPHRYDEMYEPANPTGKCCIVQSPTFAAAMAHLESSPDREYVAKELAEALGATEPSYDGAFYHRVDLVAFNDGHTTNEVLTALDRVATGQPVAA